jgi:hypothetical protein
VKRYRIELRGNVTRDIDAESYFDAYLRASATLGAVVSVTELPSVTDVSTEKEEGN